MDCGGPQPRPQNSKERNASRFSSCRNFSTSSEIRKITPLYQVCETKTEHESMNWNGKPCSVAAFAPIARNATIHNNYFFICFHYFDLFEVFLFQRTLCRRCGVFAVLVSQSSSSSSTSLKTLVQTAWRAEWTRFLVCCYQSVHNRRITHLLRCVRKSRVDTDDGENNACAHCHDATHTCDGKIEIKRRERKMEQTEREREREKSVSLTRD